jgi:hypothetical protein
MGSKYDSFWAGRLAEIRAAVEAAANGLPAVVELPGLSEIGERQSWYGVAEVCGRDVTSSSMAHATALGKSIAASGLCAPWPKRRFRFIIATAGDLLTISANDAPRAHRAELAVTARGQAPAKNAATGSRCSGSAAGESLAGDGRVRVPDGAAVGRFYLALAELAELLGGPRRLRDCHGTDGWPRHGVYFFYESGEVRADGGDRVVRVGTHALTATSKATLWGRLRQHRGYVGGSHPGGGDHRGSVFRRHVGASLVRREKLPSELLDSWLDRHGPRPGWAAQESHIELAVSRHIGAMPLLWLSVPDADDRGYVERNSIALTSGLAEGLDPPSVSWLGRYADSGGICKSGLWNVEHVRHRCEPGFLDLFEQLVEHQH